MAFVVTTRFGRRVIGRLRRLGAPSEVSPQQRAERYVAHLPTAVLGAR